MSIQSSKNSSGMARKTLALATILSLGALGLVGISSGAALGAPASATATAQTNTTKVIKLANGKTRIRVDLADNLRGKTITVKTTRVVNGKRVQVTLGKIKLTKTGKGKLTVSRNIRVGDRLVVSDGMRNIVKSKISVIEDRGSVSGGPTGPVTFTATVRGIDNAVVYEGTASGDVTVTIRETLGVPDTAVFSRGGVEASTGINLALIGYIPNPESHALIMSTAAFDVLLTALDMIPNVKIAGAASASDLIDIHNRLAGVPFDATLVTGISGDASDINNLLGLGIDWMNQGFVYIQFGSSSIAITLSDYLEESKEIAWVGPLTLDGKTVGTWAFDSSSGIVHHKYSDTANEEWDLSLFGTITSVTGY
jgi:hypothetical protein